MNCRIPSLLSALFLLLITPGVAPAGERPDIYPFDVKVGGQLAAMTGSNRLFAHIAEPVPAEAELEVPGAEGMVIVNVFPSAPDGTVPDTAAGQTKVILIQQGGKAKLDATMDGTKLAPGLYGANVVSGGRTSRVQFTVR